MKRYYRIPQFSCFNLPKKATRGFQAVKKYPVRSFLPTTFQILNHYELEYGRCWIDFTSTWDEFTETSINEFQEIERFENLSDDHYRFIMGLFSQETKAITRNV